MIQLTASLEMTLESDVRVPMAHTAKRLLQMVDRFWVTCGVLGVLQNHCYFSYRCGDS